MDIDSIIPNFLVIGAEKSGTTYLKHMLRQHPEVFVTQDKELHFFDRDENYQRGNNYYQSLFAGKENEKAIGEITPGYLVSKKAPERIFQFNPNIKLIAILRNPIDRAYSNYWMHMAKGYIACDFEKAIVDYPGYIARGMYASQLQNYLDFFSLNQMLILKYDELSYPESLFTKIFHFLDVDTSFELLNAKRKVFSSSLPKFPKINKLIVQGYSILTKLNLIFLISHSMREKVRHLLSRWNAKKDYPPMNEETRLYLASVFHDEIKELGKLLNLDFSHWL